MTNLQPPRDFPFYNGQPRSVTAVGWMSVLLGCAAGFAALLLADRLSPSWAGRWIGAILCVILPLLGLCLAAGDRCVAIFRRLTVRDVVVGIAFVPVTMLASASVAFFLQRAGLTASNPVNETLRSLHGAGLAEFFGITGLQLLGEELITVLPFLAALDALSRVGLSRTAAVAGAWLLSALLFGLLHLPTYQWRVLQAIFVIGVARLALTGVYLVTKNVWSSFITHTLNDWSLFVFLLFVGPRH